MFDVDCVASTRTYTRLMGRKPPDPPDYCEDDEDLEHLGDLDDVPDEENEGLKEVEEEDNDHKEGTNDDNTKGNPIDYSKKDDEWYANLKTVWQVSGPVKDDYEPAAAQFGMKNHAADTPYHQPVPDDNQPDDDASGHCELCYKCDQPVEVFLSHNTFDLSCPSMTDQERRQLYGSQSDWRRVGYKSR